MHIPQEKEVVDKLVAWGTAHPLIRAMILTSSRTRPDGPVDLLSDYDLILAVSDVGPFAFDDAWISEYGRPMVRWGDQGEMHGLTTSFRGVVYQNYVKIDYSIWPVKLLEHIAASAPFKGVRLNTSNSYGIDDQDFVVAFDSDYPQEFVDLVGRLRYTEASSYTQRDTPMFMCAKAPIDAILAQLANMD